VFNIEATQAVRSSEARSMVVVPSRTIDKWHEPAAETQAYEERLLCLLLGLIDPDLQVIYVTSSPVAAEIVDSYLSLLPAARRRDARARLTLFSAGDASCRPLSEKLLERPLLLRQIRRAIPDVTRCQLVPYTTTVLERDVAAALGIPMHGADPRHAHFGTKSGCRELFAAAGVQHPVGVENIDGLESATEAIAELRAAKPRLVELVMKLNEGVSGEGNAIVDVRGLPAPGAPDECPAIVERIMAMALEAEAITVEQYLERLAARGGIVEERIVGDEVRSPSAQLEISAAGEVEIVSTHDQLLGGASGQSYLGCRFPAAPEYAQQIAELARRVGRRLADAGVIGRSAIDFVVVRGAGGEWEPYAIELNLRKGGTTHPFAALQLLTGGTYDTASGTFATPSGAGKAYVATDHVEAPQLRALGLRGALSAIERAGLSFDPTRQTGVVMHMLSAVDELGRAGLTAIGDDPAEARALYDRAHATLFAAAELAVRRAVVRPLRAAPAPEPALPVAA
jgi:PGM1 C-terminal domain/ATP-grasp domain